MSSNKTCLNKTHSHRRVSVPLPLHPVSLYVSVFRMFKLAPEVSLDGILYPTADSDHDFDIRCIKSLVGLGATVSGEDHLWFVDYYVHCCLDAGPLGQVQALVILDHLQMHGLAIH